MVTELGSLGRGLETSIGICPILASLTEQDGQSIGFDIPNLET